MQANELKFFTVDDPTAPRPWTLRGGFHMRTERGSTSSAYRVEAADGRLVAYTQHSGDVFWGGHAEAKRIMDEGIEA